MVRVGGKVAVRAAASGVAVVDIVVAVRVAAVAVKAVANVLITRTMNPILLGIVSKVLRTTRLRYTKAAKVVVKAAKVAAKAKEKVSVAKVRAKDSGIDIKVNPPFKLLRSLSRKHSLLANRQLLRRRFRLNREIAKCAMHLGIKQPLALENR